MYPVIDRYYIHLQTIYGLENKKTRTVRSNDENTSKLGTSKTYTDMSFYISILLPEAGKSITADVEA